TKIVDIKFMDLLGTWQHFSVPTSELEESLFEEGLGFDGSSIRGWQAINASDMLVIPDPTTAVMDPFMNVPTLSVLCNIVDPITKEKYSRDPRNVAQKAEAYLKSTGIGDTAFFGPEPEFFIFDDVRYQNDSNQCFYAVDSEEGTWNSGRDEEPNLGHKPRHKEGYFPVSPSDSLQDIRTEMLLLMEQVGIAMECHHHEVATAGQCEIDMRFAPLVQCADNLMWYKYIVKNVAKRYGKTATFMPKPLFNDNGTGMHVHQSIWKDGNPLFAGNGYAGFSEMGLNYIGGILKHASAICAFAAPTTNSYKRLVPGFEAPVNLAYSSRNRSAAIRIPMYSPSPKAKRMEARFPDPSSNGYLAFAVMLMAGLDGIENKIDPGEPLDKNIYALGPEELANIPTLPTSLEGALGALESDHDFLLKGDVFTQDLIDTWIEYKRENEVDQLRLRPHPYEMHMYYDV
ncbi:MAG: type I glutamate--ammonia ligase, partial [Nitrospinaceae bacterium]|nr:type I glutamate--ammonia ligase [Nitrospinaceae bacterium]MDP6658000.1 type I glutamate--ammonia ligase [Nitrospinaceae bacterium]HAK37661.1 type I glutamate--ammonia ligase [Nitrospina sp.]